MHIYIDYEGVFNHLDLLSKESQKCSQLIETLRYMSKEMTTENLEQEVRLKKVIRQVENFQESISRRRDLILEIISILKKANIKTDILISEMAQTIDKVDNGGLDG